MRTIKEDHSPGHAIRLLSQRAPITRVAKTANTSGSFVFFYFVRCFYWQTTIGYGVLYTYCSDTRGGIKISVMVRA